MDELIRLPLRDLKMIVNGINPIPWSIIWELGKQGYDDIDVDRLLDNLKKNIQYEYNDYNQDYKLCKF